MGSVLSTKVYKENNYALDTAQRFGDSLCLLDDRFIIHLTKPNLVTVEGVVWWAGLTRVLDSDTNTSPGEWIAEMEPTVYKDALGKLLSLERRVKTWIGLCEQDTAL
jgi:hypothetical protein